MQGEILMAILLGILIVTLIDSIGSITSRRFNFNYGWFIIFSILTYTLIPYYLSKKTSFEIALISNCIIGIYDATIGYKISLILKANNGAVLEDDSKMTLPLRLVIVLVLSFILAYLGYTLGNG
jgi:hypothetical protein